VDGDTVTVTEEAFALPAKPTPDEGGIVRDRWGRYVLPDPETGQERGWTRATTWAKTISDTFKLHQWQERMVAKGLAVRPDLYTLVGTIKDDDPDAKNKLNRICEDAKLAAGSKVGANLGTAIHNYTEQADRGIEVRGIPSTIANDIASYSEALRAHGLATKPEYIERVILNTKLGVAGRLDRIMWNTMPIGRWDEPGTYFIGDVKTAANIGYSWLEVAIQLAIYANADYFWNIETKTYEPMPKLDLSEAIVMHVPVQQGYTDLYRVDIEMGWTYAKLAGLVREARADKRLASRLGQTIMAKPIVAAVQDDRRPELDIRARIDQATCIEDLSDIWGYAEPRGLWSPELEAYGLQKAEDLRG
jgi:hypothetical protein